MRVDSAGGLANVRFVGHVTPTDMLAHLDEVRARSSEFRRGFILLTELTELESMDPDCAPVLSQVMDCFDSYGVSRVVRVVPSARKDIGFNILSLFHYKAGVSVNTCNTSAEAADLVKFSSS